MSRYGNDAEDRLFESVYYEMLDAHEDNKLSWDRVLEIVFDAIRSAMHTITDNEED